MRTEMWIAIGLLLVTIAAGVWSSREAKRLSDRYVSAAEELRIMTASEQWPRARETAQAYLAAWTKTVPWLQVLINHEDIDDVTLALERLLAGVEAQDRSACFETCAELRENALHIYHRDAFTLGNVL